ncbi:Colicin I receptor precursor [Salinivirga cyanobacteriivorans]|uniref:Colicin I receptor n=1 Tax=Salinivirga cyanobacteriivorans TaxID=1307839 RepID=A0A0S2I4K8_9BACT|nr:TonB-dependent receptor [Salinivirga cyanobacteriivorans]ALO17352.1 Colicin I receptor precursor [Salinivirga cyanobacteriivorans]
MKKIALFLITSIFYFSAFAQHSDANIFGDVQSEGEHVPFATIYIEGTTIGTATDETGHYYFIDLPEGELVIVAKAIGYKTQKKTITVVHDKTLEVNFELERDVMALDEVVVTGTKTFKRITDAPVIVNLLDKKTINAVQACNISEGLKFQPGLRVETDCQTCNYTQLRMNGLGGGYSQILINGRPVFSPLIGLYGMEQIPANMVDRIEVVRGGGSALYGSSAIGGTVNVITQMPQRNTYDISYTSHSINGRAMDNVLSGNVSMVTRQRNAGVVLYVNNRYREAYDHTGLTLNTDGSLTEERDGYSELPELRSNSFGANMFFKPTPNQKIEVNFSSIHEYRYGGEITDKTAHLALQSEERTHDILMGGIDYQINFNEDNSSFIAYFAGQNTDRDHYTGLYPVLGDYSEEPDPQVALEEALDEHLTNPPYGTTDNTTLQGGLQINHRLNDFFGETNVLTGGIEHKYDDVVDSIPAYEYGTNQQTNNAAVYLQSDWNIGQGFTLLLGARADKHNLVDNVIVSPRISLMYKYRDYTQLRLTWGTGFRAPQAFDADMHIAFAGGGISRIILGDDLKEERSNSISGSINFDYPEAKYILGFTLEGFYTKLDDAFYLQPIGGDALGEVFEKRNGPGATVQGATIELRANYNKQAQIEGGFTFQSSLHDEAVENIDGLPAKKKFLRTPEAYGYVVLTYTPNDRWDASINTVYTGEMLHAKFSPDPDILADEYRTSDPFTEISIKVGHTIPIKTLDSGIEIYAGVKNITNNFQDDFDNYRNRDSNYMYGPALPRTFYVGVKLKSF